MFEDLALDISPRAASVYFGLALGVAFGALAQLTKFCLRRAVVGVGQDGKSARGVWAMAFAVALVGTQLAVAQGWIGFGDHRFHLSAVPVLAILTGGLIFGVGAVMARGCISRLTVLTGAGNLRALAALFVFAVAAHATLKGVFGPIRTGLASFTSELGDGATLAGLPGGAVVWTLALAVIALFVVIRSGASLLSLAGAALLGLLVPVGWIGTGFVLFDEFDPINLESLSFTSPWAETLFWGITSSAIEPGFGVGLIGGVIAGAIVAALGSGQFRWQSFEAPAQMGRSLFGAALMGIGGVLAGGCTVGAGLAGIPTLSVAALLALVAMIAGMAGAGEVDRILSRRDARSSGAAGAVPAE